MASLADLADVEGFLSTVVLLLKNVTNSIVENNEALVDGDGDVSILNRVTRMHDSLVNINTIIASIFHGFKLSHMRAILDEDLNF